MVRGGAGGNGGTSLFQVEFGTVTGGVFTATDTEVTGAQPDTVFTNNPTIHYYDFTLGTPELLVPGTTYAVDISTRFATEPHASDYPYLPLATAGSDVYAGGTVIDGTAANSSDDLVFYALGTAAVPEPATLSLLTISSLGLLIRRRRLTSDLSLFWDSSPGALLPVYILCLWRLGPWFGCRVPRGDQCDDEGRVVRQFLVLASILLGPAAAFASNVDYGSLMFLGDSITVGQDGSNSGYRGFLIQDLNPVPWTGPGGTELTPQPGQGIFSSVGHEPVDVIFVSLEPWDRR